MAFKLLDMAQQRWRRLDGAHLLPLVRAGKARSRVRLRNHAALPRRGSEERLLASLTPDAVARFIPSNEPKSGFPVLRRKFPDTPIKFPVTRK
jgi:hypothetical protein